MASSRYQDWINEWRDLSQRDNDIMDQLEYGRLPLIRQVELMEESGAVRERMNRLCAMMKKADQEEVAA